MVENLLLSLSFVCLFVCCFRLRNYIQSLMNDKHVFYDTSEPHPQHLKVHKHDSKQNFYLFVEVKMYHGK